MQAQTGTLSADVCQSSGLAGCGMDNLHALLRSDFGWVLCFSLLMLRSLIRAMNDHEVTLQMMLHPFLLSIPYVLDWPLLVVYSNEV